MLVISDSYTFLLENTAKSKNFNIHEINLDQRSYENLIKSYDYSLILLSESFQDI